VDFEFLVESLLYLLRSFEEEGLCVYRNDSGGFEVPPLSSLAELQHYTAVLEIVEAILPFLPGKVASAFSESANTTTAQAINTAATSEASAGK
jgi:hypothetical protein